MAAEPASKSFASQVLVTYGYMVNWIVLSAGVILFNKYILTYANFPYPMALTCTHMGFCSILAWILVKTGICEAAHISNEMYFKCIVPIGFLFAITLWLGNAAYLSLSVSFIQMLKASMPLVVYCVGCIFQTETYNATTALNMVAVVGGIVIASYGEVQFVLLGFLMQVGSICSEAVRLTLVQLLLQSRGIKLNPVSTLYHIAPCCFVFLFMPFLFMELPSIMAASSGPTLHPGILLLSAAAAFALNMSVFLLIGRTSALTMNVAGVVKDWLLIGLSVLIFKSTVTKIQLLGYGIAFLGVTFYNYKKIQAMKAAHQGKTESATDSEKADEVKEPLIPVASQQSFVNPIKRNVSN